jgi:rSAM/selenodomain-associated transferase 1
VIAHLLVLAKEPVAGAVKTRLTARWSAQQAADLAAAALADTLSTATSWARGEATCVLAGRSGPWLPPGTPVVPQVAGSLGERIAAAFETAFAAAAGPVLLVGMDTPQLTHRHLDTALAALADADAVLGPAQDGGWWLLGLRAPATDAIVEVETSRADTGALQRSALVSRGLRIADLETLTDVDTPEDAAAVAAEIPQSAFARAFQALERAA